MFSNKDLIKKIEQLTGEKPYIIGMRLYAGSHEQDVNYHVDENGYPMFDKPINCKEALEKMLSKLQNKN